MTSIPLTSDQALRIKVLRFVTGGPTAQTPEEAVGGEPSVTDRYQIDPGVVQAYETQLVTWSLMRVNSTFPEPRYTITAGGWAYIALAQHNGQVLTAQGVLDDVPEGTFGGNVSDIANALPALVAAGLIVASSGWTMTTE